MCILIHSNTSQSFLNYYSLEIILLRLTISLNMCCVKYLFQVFKLQLIYNASYHLFELSQFPKDPKNTFWKCFQTDQHIFIISKNIKYLI